MKIEEAIKKLETSKSLKLYYHPHSDTEYIDMAIEVLKESQWISDRPPEESGEYIVMIYGEENPTFLVYRKDIGRFCDDYDNKYNVTHWKPLPKAPEV